MNVFVYVLVEWRQQYMYMCLWSWQFSSVVIQADFFLRELLGCVWQANLSECNSACVCM